MKRNWKWLLATGVLGSALAVGAYAYADNAPTSPPANGPAATAPDSAHAHKTRPPKYGGTVQSVDGSGNITLQSPKGTLQVTVTSSTTYDLGRGLKAQASDVQTGDRLAVDGTLSGTTVAATAVHIRLPEAGGTVVSNDGSTLALRRSIWSTSVSLSGNPSVLTAGGAVGTLSDITVGQRVSVLGRVSNGSMTARAIRVLPARVMGTVSAKSDSSLTLSTEKGSVTVNVNGSTQYKGYKDLSDIQTGDRVLAQGAQDTNPLLATVVAKPPAHNRHGAQGEGGWHRGGPDGHGAPGEGGWHGGPGGHGANPGGPDPNA